MQTSQYRITTCLFYLISTFLILTSNVYAQLASIAGKVMDPTGAVVINAKVILNSHTGAERAANTDAAGMYRLLQLSPGSYALRVEKTGFKTTKQNIDLLVDTPATLDVRLQIGEINEVVIVETGFSSLNTQDTALGNAFEGMRIRQLPLQDRNVASLLTLQAGVTPDGYVGGARSDQTNLTLDGIDINDQQTGDWAHPVLRVTPDSIQEFKVTTNIATAAQGRSAGGQIALITRTGTNDLHGSLYYSNRSSGTSANDFFNNRTGVPRPYLRRDLFGGSLGGPIAKDRAFFFYNYEGLRDDQEAVVGPQVVPLPSLGQGIVKYNNMAGGITAVTSADLNRTFPVGINPAALAALADAARKYPANDDGVGDGLNTGGFRFNASTPMSYNAHTATMSFNLTGDARHVLLLRANYQQDSVAGTPQFPGLPASNLWSHPSGLAIQHTWTASSNLVNTLRFGLTREALSQQGDSTANQIVFQGVYSPSAFTRNLDRITPTWNVVNDITWLKGNHSFAFGGNVRIIRNRRTSFANSYDSASTNPFFLEGCGVILTNPFPDIAGGLSDVQNAIAAVLGRYAQYSSSFNFGADQNLMPAGVGVRRTFASEQYEMYAQDAWRVQRDLTLTFGLRYSLDRPVYETNGLEVTPTTSLSAIFDRRAAAAAAGTPDDELVSLDKSGPVNGKPPMYDWNKKNFAPRAGFAWQPNFDHGLLQKIFGAGQKSVIRGGFDMAYDNLGNALAVTFDMNNMLGYSAAQQTPPLIYNSSDSPGPLFTGFNQVIRTLPGITIPSKLVFPLSQPADASGRIEFSLDRSLKTPVNYLLNFSVAREFAFGLTVEAAYVGRMARNLLAQRDVMPLNNLVDKKSGMDWYTAAGMLYSQRWNNVPISLIKPIPYFENLFPNYRQGDLPTATASIYSLVARDGGNAPDWATLQSTINGSGIFPSMFFQPQYGALDVWSTVGFSDYHAAIVTVRERFRNDIRLDFNYTFSKSIDNASGLQSAGPYSPEAFIINSLRPNDEKAVSGFDMRHIINANVMWDLPLGRGHAFLGSIGSVADRFLGGWQLTNVFRWNSGLPESSPYDAATWATNWNIQSNGARLRPIESSPTKAGDYPNLFADPEYAYQSFRNPMPGQSGDRNILRRQGYVALDAALNKSFKIAESHSVQFRWEVFNVTNTQRLGAIQKNSYGLPSTLGLGIDAPISAPPAGFGNISKIQGTPRVMQFGLRYQF